MTLLRADGMAEAPERKRSISTFLMIATFGIVLLIMFDNNLRLATGRAVGTVLEPVTTVWGNDPMLTILFASVIMILATTAIRHFLVDWVQMARVQEVMRAFQKEFAEARKANNTYKLKRLTDMQPELMKMQADLSTGQLKPMAFTMLIVIPIFAWLSTFVLTLAPDGATCAPFIQVPWNGQWSLGAHGKDVCAEGWWWILPHWIILYSLFSIPIGQITQKALKLWEYSKVDLDSDGRAPGLSVE